MGRAGFAIAKKLAVMPGLRIGKRWREPEVIAVADSLIADLSPPDEPPEEGVERGTRAPGWRWQAAKMRDTVRRLREELSDSEPEELSCLAVLGYAAGDDSLAPIAERALGNKLFRLLSGKRKSNGISQR